LLKSRWKIGLLTTASLLLLLLAAGCHPAQSFDERLQTITAPYRFHLTQWEFESLISEIGKLFQSPDNATAQISAYFHNVERINTLEAEIEAVKAGERTGDLPSLEGKLSELRSQNRELASLVESLLERQIREALTQEGIYNPADRYSNLKVGFPPVNFTLGRPPHLLVVSPRDRIERIREVILLPEMGEEDMEDIESQVDSLGVSSLVVELGGMATFPSYVTDDADLRFVLDTAVEEWLHQYLAFTPLGFRYVLDLAGIRRDYDIATMNETVASMVSKEIGGIIYSRYYAREETGKNEPKKESGSGFDFNKEMREIRQTVDDLLAQGEIDQAEAFMEQKRQYLAANGYYLRKLNQAYFAFFGTYADSPTSISPIGTDIKELRNRSASLKSFLDTVTVMTSRRELADSVR
jgi:hypothetical protein